MGETKVTRRSFVKGAAGLGAAVAIGSTTEKSGATIITNKTSNASSGKSLQKGKVFKDSLGRHVKLPEKINSIVPSGKYAEAVIMTLCPDKLASVTEPLDAGEKRLFRRAGMSRVNELPKSGELYASESRDGNNNLSVSSIKKTNPDIVLDVGTRKSDLRSNISFLQRKSGVPVVFIDGSFGKLPEVYRLVGSLTGDEVRAEKLASFIETLWKAIESIRDQNGEKANIYFAKNDKGICSSEGYSFVNKAIEHIGANPISTGSTNNSEIEIEDLAGINIDYILFNDYDTFEEIVRGESGESEKWWTVPAVLSGKIALAPTLFHNWIGFPLFVQVVGIVWMGRVIYPESFKINMMSIAKEFYSLFYRYTISKTELERLTLYEEAR